MNYVKDMRWDAAISALTVKEEAQREAEHNPSGKISAGMMAQPVLECVLKLIGVPGKAVEPYVLRKFARGRQVEDWLVEQMQKAFPGVWEAQKEVEYRGGIGFIDLFHKDDKAPHEVKSVTNLKFKRITQGAFDKDQFGKRVKGEPKPDAGHVLQATWYGLATGSEYIYLHYVASDDLRLHSLKIPTSANAAQVDDHILQISMALDRGQLPGFHGFLGWHGMSEYSNYPQFVDLTSEQAEALLKESYPNAYKKLKEGVKLNG